MNYRINKVAILAVCVLLLLAAGLFGYTIFTASPEDDTSPADETTNETAQPDEDRIISGKRQFEDGIHTIAGMTTTPTPCHSILIDPFFPERATSTVELRFTTVLEGNECPAVESDATFQTAFEAPENVSISATWNGVPVRLNLVPVGPGESLEEEFFFKG